MTDRPQEILYRRTNLLGSIIVIGGLVFALALAVTVILLNGKIQLANHQAEARLDELSRKVAELSDRVGGPGPGGATQPDIAKMASSPSPDSAGAVTPPSNDHAAAKVAAATSDSGPATQPDAGSVAAAGPAPALAPATAPAPPSDDGGYNVSPVSGLLGPNLNRPAGLAGWFYDLRTSAVADEQNPMLLVVRGPRTVAAALAELAKADPAEATGPDANPKISPEDLANAAQLFLQSGNDVQAYRWATTATVAGPKMGRAWLVAGLAAARQKQWPDAIAKLTQAADLLPGRPEPLKALGLSQLAAGKLDLAIAAYRRAVAAVPGDTALAFGLADLLIKARRFDDATRELQQIVAADPKLSAARARLAMLLVETDRPKDALELLDATPPNATSEIRLDLARGQALLATNDPAGAEAVLAKLVDQAPLSAEGWYLLGKARVKQHKNAQAIVALERSIAVDSTYAEAWQYLGVALANDGRLDEAISKLQEAIQLNVSSAEMHYMLAVLCLTKRQPEAALEALKRAVKLDPSYLGRTRGEDLFKGLPADSAIGKFLKEGK